MDIPQSSVPIDPGSVWAQFEPFENVKPFQIRVLGLRGYWDADHVNRNGIYDDLLVISTGPTECVAFDASLDPGIHYIEHPINPLGCARICKGLWWYKPGLLHGEWPCFVQAAPIDVERLDQDGNISSIESHSFVGADIHSGGPGHDVGNYSAGCAVIHDPTSFNGPRWQEFFHLLVNEMAGAGQHVFPFLVNETLKASPAKEAA